jgi:SAM-dependent methyltransferase
MVTVLLGISRHESANKKGIRRTQEGLMMNTPLIPAAPTWDERYGAAGFLYGTEPNAYLASQRSLFVSGKKALVVADGEGRNGVWLAQQGLEVDAFDLSAVGVAKARQLAQRSGVAVNFEVSDCEPWRWPADAYDYVVAIFIQFAAPALRQRLFANMVGSLKRGGYLILQGYTPTAAELASFGPQLLDHLYTEEMLRAAFAGMALVDFQVYQAVVAEQVQQSEPSALIGLVAQK